MPRLVPVLDSPGIIAGGQGGVAFDVSSAASLPGQVTDKRIFVETSTTPTGYYINTNEPTSPTAGDVWIQVAAGSVTLELSAQSPFAYLSFVSAKQYTGSRWNKVSAYLGIQGVWVLFSSSLLAPGQPLSAYGWDDIDAISRSGQASDYWTIGTTNAIKEVSIGGVTYEVEVVGYGHDDLADGSGKAGITFATKNCLGTTRAMNASSTNSGGWNSSQMRGACSTVILPGVSADLLSVIKPVLKTSSSGSASSVIQTATDSLWLFSEIEIFGQVTYSYAGEGAHYSQRFTNATNRIKNVGSSAQPWWLRSPYSAGSANFCLVHSTGATNLLSANSPYGVCVGFCV